MILTNKSITKNLTKVLGENKVNAYVFGFGKKYKKGVLVLTNDNKIVLTSAPLFGQPKIKLSIDAKDIDYIDFVHKVTLNATTFLFFKPKNGEKERFKIPTHFVNDDSSLKKIIFTVYDLNPKAKPAYYGDDILIDFIASKDGTLKIFRDKILIQTMENDEIKTVETIPVEKITDFDMYKQTMATKVTLYLEIDGNPRTFKIQKQENKSTVLETLAGTFEGTVFHDYPTIALIETFKKTNIKRPYPSFLHEGETPLVDEKVVLNELGSETMSNKYFVLTPKRITILQRGKGGKRTVFKEVPIADIQHVTAKIIKKENSTTYGFIFTTTSGEKIKVFDVDYFEYVKKKLQEFMNLV